MESLNSTPPFFWLHIKKSAGISTRKLLQPHYHQVNRKKTLSFEGKDPKFYNDILNNYRVDLGDYQFKRTLYARKFLFPEHWSEIISFAFVREPKDRCISMFYYLYFKRRSSFLKQIELYFRNYTSIRKLNISTEYSFDAFLDFVHRSQNATSVKSPLGVHFSTHTARMWEDITDENGKILLTDVFRLEQLNEGIEKVLFKCGLPKPSLQNETKLNKTKDRVSYQPTKEQLTKIEKLYDKDFDLYESTVLL